ncbi:hypothetical protein VCUG_01589 [Vavraia culicis subsp. floridensis]|uniref:Rad50/SbcC-type AAA domain-containing protein n=1 Tax=Vavraia culicis (isolate floridensis) TaxID=948595 RepID=L2GTC1_VAVCU|nr:uncharacterized protein VCUG_01589 [Vavraia culicis subsp. floridensis]ELA46891.1 hypothetical protein VCUG_01589 [Vavraia culicis subsp. floridensis]
MILNKLMIRGIRSYSPNTSNVIQFFPMTLILGENGTGKTTIIEALRYAITGDLPPMSRGGAFVYDPMLNSSTDTNAQIKLKLCDRYVVSRSLSLTHRKSKIEQKNTENVFSVIVNDVASESYGNNMENLCNNEELGDALGWKKDDGANNNVEGIKKRIKSLSGKAADIDKQMLMVLNTNKPLLDHVIFCHQEESTWPLSEPANFKKKMDDIFCSTVYIKAIENLKNVRKEKGMQLKMKLQELNFALQAKKKREELLARLERANEDLMNNRGTISNLEGKLRVLNEKRSAQQRIMEEIRAQSEKLLVLDVRLRNTSTKSMEIIADEVVDKYRDYMLDEQAESKARNELERVKKEHARFKEEQERAERIKKTKDEYVYKKKALIEDIRSINMHKNVCDLRIFDNSDDLSNEKGVVRSMRTFYERFREILIERDRTVSETDNDAKELEKELEALSREENSLEYALRANTNAVKNTEKSKFGTNDLEIRINEAKALRDSKSETVNAIHRDMDGYVEQIRMSKRKDEIEQYLSDNTGIDDGICIEKIGEEIKAFKLMKQGIFANRAAMSTVLSRMRDLNINYLSGNGEEKLTCENIEELNEILKADHKNADASKIEYEHVRRFFEELKECDLVEIPYSTLRELESAISSNKNAAHIYKDLKKLGEKRNACVLCNKPFVNNELTTYLAKLDYVIEKIPEKENEKREEYKKLMEKVEKDEKENAVLNKFNNLLREIKGIGEVEYGDDSFCATCKYSKKLCTDTMASPHKECKTGLYSILDRTNRFEIELHGIKQDLREIIDVKKIKEEIENYNREIKGLEVALMQNLEYEKDVLLRNNIKKLEIKIARLNEDKLEKLKQKERLIGKLEEDKAELIGETARMNLLKQKIGELEGYLGMIESSANVIYQSFNEEAYFKQILDLSKVLSDYENDKFMTNRVLEYLKHKEEMERIDVIKEEIVSIKLSIQKKKQEMMAINDSDKVKEILLLLGLSDIGTDEIIKSVEKEINTREGTNKQLTQNVKEYTLQLEEKGPDYSEIYTHTKILDIMLKDLDKSIKAIEKSVLKYYENKIEELNRNLKYLWSNTYRGNDIDRIELKAEITSSKYSYKLVMYKNDVELEMRGRCSAGQKVIASLIFRLALSITFSCNCNMLTLDEPTTNLDQSNIESLARTLKYLERMSNLQLIIITHDEEFLNLVSKDSVEYFYKVTRNSSCESVIERHSVY